MGKTPTRDILELHGNFETSGDPFFSKDAGVTITSGECVFTSVATGAGVYKAAATVGKQYEVAFTITDRTGGSVRPQSGAGIGATRSTTGSFVETIRAANANIGIFVFQAATLKIDDLYIREVVDYNHITTAVGGRLRV